MPFSTEQLSEDAKAFYTAIQEKPARPSVLISAAFLEHALAGLLGRFFIKDGRTEEALKGPLESFFGRTVVARCLGLISEKMYHNLRKIGTIRNHFAHSPLPMDFRNPEIAKWCKELILSPFDNKSLRNARDRFTVVAVELFNALQMSALETTRLEERRDLSVTDYSWPRPQS
jgi:hypothetical protein